MLKISNIILKLVTVVTLATLTWSCHSSRQVTASSTSSVTSSTSTALAPMSTPASHGVPAGNDAIDRLVGSYSNDWTDFSASVTLALEAPKSMTLSGKMTVVNGAGFNISLRMLGFEVAAITVVGDSIFAYEKMGKRAVAESVTSIARETGITTADVVSLLLGQIVLPGGNAVIEPAAERQVQIYTATDGPVQIGWLISTPSDTNAQPVAAIIGTNSSSGQLTYRNFVSSPAGPVAGQVQVSATTAKAAMKGTMSVAYSGAKWNTGARLSRPSLGSYQIVKFDQLLNILKSL
ncbi:MAG: DUF4292 domain-containing protein [Muribaculaceae bacterium]|nr:DUF4292 domain-containing protein [Muribaculaceae bacterium]